MLEKDIKVTFNYAGEEIILHTYKNEYRNLMQLIHDQVFIEGFGYCQGMGRCGTCMVAALNRIYTTVDYDRNELSTLRKSISDITNIRLSCQLQIDKAIDGLHIKIMEPDL